MLWKPVCQLLWRLLSHNWLQLQGNVRQSVLLCSAYIYITPVRLIKWLIYRICLTRIVIGMTNVSTVPSVAALWWKKHLRPRMICCCALNVMPMIIPPSATTARKPSCQVCLMMKNPAHWENPIIALCRLNGREQTNGVELTSLEGFRQSDRSGQSSRTKIRNKWQANLLVRGKRWLHSPGRRQKEEVKPIKPPNKVCRKVRRWARYTLAKRKTASFLSQFHGEHD